MNVSMVLNDLLLLEVILAQGDDGTFAILIASGCCTVEAGHEISWMIFQNDNFIRFFDISYVFSNLIEPHNTVNVDWKILAEIRILDSLPVMTFSVNRSMVPRWAKCRFRGRGYGGVFWNCGRLPSLKLTASLHLKMDGWKTLSFPFGARPIFRGFCC